MSEATTSKDVQPVDNVQAVSEFLPLRIWPAVLLLAIGITCRVLPRLVEGVHWMVMVFGPMLCGLVLILWWLAASRASIQEKIAGLLGFLAAIGGTSLLLHPTMLGPERSLFSPGFMMITLQSGFAAFAVAAILFSRVLSFRRTILIVLVTLCGFGYTTLFRNEGMRGNGKQDLAWRWSPSAEELMLGDLKEDQPAEPTQLTSATVDEDLANPEWPAFRGPNRDGIQRGTDLVANWKQSPPEQLWKIKVGPGWSSFAVAGDLLFTQEQLGPQELVVCYSAEDGSQLWTYQIETRFEESMGGVGPRATPTIADGALFTMGASGHLTRHDPKTGEVVWQQDLREVAEREPPMWGFSASPLVTNGLVIVHAGGEEDKGTLAFDAESGELRWSAPAGDHSYCSAQLASIAGQEVVLMVTNQGLDLLDPEQGTGLLNYEWETEQYRAVQPKTLADDHVLIPTGMGYGTRRIRVTAADGKLSAEEIWSSMNLKADYNDFVIYAGHAYGFDGNIFTCINLEDGKREWKRGRYGNGQVLLVEESGLLLVLSETGDLVLLKATPEAHEELAKVPALEGKTWNHPVLIGDRLYIRNAQEAACFRMKIGGGDDNAEPETPLASR